MNSLDEATREDNPAGVVAMPERETLTSPSFPTNRIMVPFAGPPPFEAVTFRPLAY